MSDAAIDWTARAGEARTKPRNVPSPCISVCVMESGLCKGCWRTLDEIAAWSTMKDEDKRTVWGRIEARVGASLSMQGAKP